jgi:Family of unknown function (DUF6496)
MPDQETLDRAREDAREGKSPSTQAGEFVREEVHHIREGKHGAASAKQAIAIGLSKARRAGVKLPAPKASASASTRKKAEQDTRASKEKNHKTSARRSRATTAALRKEPSKAASHKSLSNQAKKSAAKRGKQNLSRAARKAAQTRKAA